MLRDNSFFLLHAHGTFLASGDRYSLILHILQERRADLETAEFVLDLVTEERASSHVQAARRIFQWLDQELGRE